MFEIGSSLREARLRQRLDFSEVEQAIKVRAKYLRALEEEQFETLPAPTYVKGFLRAYADYLGLDGQLYVDEFNSRYLAGDEEPVQPSVRRGPARPRPQRRVERNVVLFALVAIAVVTALVIAAWKFGAPKAQDTAFDNLSRTPPASTLRTKSAATPVAKKPHRPRRVHLVVVAAHGNCWLQVHAGSAVGRPLYEGTLEQGQSQTFVARRVWLNVGAPEVLTAKLNGRRVTLPSHGPAILLATPRGLRAASTGT